MQLELSRGDIITEGLSLAGRPDLLENARLWFALFLEEFYYNQDFDWLVQNAELTLSDGMSMPTDYRAAKSAKVTTSSGSSYPIRSIRDVEEYDAKRTNDGATGIPTEMYTDPKARKFYFLPAPEGSLTLELKYLYIPEISDPTVSALDTDIPTWELPKGILIDFIKAMAMEHNDDSRQNDAHAKVRAKIAEAKLNARDHRAGSSKMKMGKSFSKRF